jgi:hypothetical protein
LLAIFAFARRWPRAEPALAKSTLALAAAFSLVQLSTHLYPGDTAITGEGRLFALHMFDARVRCEARAILHLPDGGQMVVELSGGGGNRASCDPILVRGTALNLCHGRLPGVPELRDLDLRLDARRETDPELYRVIEIDRFCANPPSYSAFVHNDWIRVR